MTLFLSVFFGTFVLEDLALASALVLIAQQKLSFATAFFACFLGISIGDIGLYLLGNIASHFKLEKRFSFFKKYNYNIEKFKTSDFLTYSIVISRLIPGTRLPTYISAGYLRYSFLKFTILTVISVFLWVLLALMGGKAVYYIFMDHKIVAVVAFFIFLNLLKNYVPRLMDYWERKALKSSWRKWTQFEFWPSIFFYIPLYFYYIYFSIKYKSPFMPFYANPNLPHGGLIGESKWDFLKHLDLNDSSTLKSVNLKKESDFFETKTLLDNEGFKYPFIMKPDIGQRGFGVRIIRNDFDLTEYLLLSNFEIIIQSLSTLPNEAGLFFIRKPSVAVGSIFSVTDKSFPYVIGDGKTKLGDLILQDKRAQIIASTYFSRLKEILDTIPTTGEKVYLSECGNHCQGAIFHNGVELISDELTLRLDSLAKKIPDFFFGRFDVRYKNKEDLKLGLNFEIVEINGAGAEATHIWDANTKLLEAYRTLFIQWDTLFAIGKEVSLLQKEKLNLQIISFLKECFKVYFRKDALSTSS